MKILVSPSFIKQIARKIKKSRSLKHCHALDEAAKQYGFYNYKNYTNTLEFNNDQSHLLLAELLKNISLEEDLSNKEHLATSFLDEFEVSIPDLFKIIDQLRNFKNIQSLCERSNLQIIVQTSIEIDMKTTDTLFEIQSDNPYYVPKDVAVKDLSYVMDERKIYVMGEYNLTLETEFEFNEEDKHLKELPHFADRSIGGTFDLTIDKNGNIELIDITVTHERACFSEDELEEYFKLFPEDRALHEEMESFSLFIEDALEQT